MVPYHLWWTVKVYFTSMYTGGNMLSTRFSSSATARYAVNISSTRQNSLKHIPYSMMWEYVIEELSTKTYRKHLPVVTNTHYSLSKINKIICISIFHIGSITVCYYLPIGRRKLDPKNRGIQSFCILPFNMFSFLAMSVSRITFSLKNVKHAVTDECTWMIEMTNGSSYFSFFVLANLFMALTILRHQSDSILQMLQL